MKLSQLVQHLNILEVKGPTDIEISGLSEDSRKVEPGSLFFARKGFKVSGLQFIQDAVKKGAAAVLTEEEVSVPGVTVLRAKSMEEAQPVIADRFYEHPSGDLTMVGVTGTNGKTTITYLLEAIAREAGFRTAVIGTVNYRIPSEGSDHTDILPAPNTTPNALELQSILAECRKRKTDLVVMEVSSHALAQKRVLGIDFDGAVFTNLTQDHLDYHKTLERYGEEKAKLFGMISKENKRHRDGFPQRVRCGKFSIINADDPSGGKMALASPVPPVWYGIRSAESLDFFAEEIVLEETSSRFQLVCQKNRWKVRLGLPGKHNVYNALASAAAAVQLGIPMETVVRALEKVEPIPGRMEPVDSGQDFTVLVDFAHTEDALKNVLTAVRGFAKKRVLTLFGCGGDRDKNKRPKMGAAASEMSDWVVVTSDNPRSEDPRKILLDIEEGTKKTGKNNYETVLDREEAIEKIIGLAQAGDVVVLAGKGHETYQIFSDHQIHFDDREVARKMLQKKQIG